MSYDQDSVRGLYRAWMGSLLITTRLYGMSSGHGSSEPLSIFEYF